MITENEKTAPDELAATGSEQSPNDNTIISTSDEKVNSSDDKIIDYRARMRQMLDPSYLPTISMDELFENVYQSKPPIIDGLLYPGTYLFVGAPKLGKSFFMAQLAYHVSTGTPLWNYSVRKGTVLYLALEDDYRRLQERLYRMFGTEGTENLYFSVSAHQLGNGLNEQLQGFIAAHSDTNLVIIDTLQKVREVGGESYCYASDYEVITQLKRLADSYGICLLLVHHTRKQKADDNFDMISGTNGLLGSADGAFILQKEKRTANKATLEIAGRDQQDQRLNLVRNVEKLSWELESAETELWKEPPDLILEAVAKIVTAESPEWAGTPTELCERLGVDIPVNTLTKRLNVNAGRLKNSYGIEYRSSRTHDGRRIEFRLSNNRP